LRAILPVLLLGARENLLNSSLPNHLSVGDHAAFSKAIGSTVAAIQLDVMNKLLADHPALESEIEANLAKYGRCL